MTDSSASSPARPTPTTGQGLSRLLKPVAAALLLIGSLGVLFWQVEVTHGATEQTRSCGSAFDSFADRSGWQQWWASDLDEPEGAVRSSLLRTRSCPSAVNRRILIASVLGALGLVTALMQNGRFPGALTSGSASTTSSRIAALGRTTSLVGIALTVAGLIAVILLVADADSTLFLYMDRVVVGVAGLIVLIPTLVLVLLGRVLSMVGRHLEASSGDG